MSILSGFKKARAYKKTDDGYIWESRDVHGETVYFNDNDTAETKVGAIKGITTSTDVTEEGYAADATTVAALNYNLEEVKTSFQDGCEQIVAALTAKGATPASNNLNDILTAINNIKTDVKHRVQLNEVSTGINWANLGFVKYFTVSVDGTVIFTSSNYNIATSYGGGGTIMDTYI